MRFAKIPEKFNFEYVICHQKADYVLKFTRRDTGDIHSYFCERCFKNFKTNFRKDNLTEIKLSED